jgi:hypothetical protein
VKFAVFGDFVCKKACIKWDRASSGELRYVQMAHGDND